MSEKAAYYAAADCCVVSAVRDGLNRIPYSTYRVAARRAPSPAPPPPAMENGSSSSAAQQQQRSSVVVVSEFVGCSPSLGGAIRVNPFCERSVAEGNVRGAEHAHGEKQARHRRNYAFLAVFVGLGFGLGYRAIAFHAGFKSLVPEHVVPAYRAAAHRLIVLQCDGTMVPNAEVTELLNELCADPMTSSSSSADAGVNKGVAVEALISAMARRGEAPDFVLCFGDDENMFEALAGVMDEKKMPPLLPAGARVFTCTIGKAPSKAAFYLDEPPDVIAVLRGMLATTGSSSSSSSSSRLQPAVPPVRAPRRLGLFEIVSLVNNGSG
ncbi:hypothetical protein PR202_gb22569 [Eleusine coracana subsp. coracana]|uniref:Uncharacterized protein n=1 Tax=Eleusine coracana subsp. coracana TaxID=191504 RepID=A0AAV5FH03_ELECO|nr:hypothetical protein PR202_gb22569 [Eleusine coracana subsp. coracana]